MSKYIMNLLILIDKYLFNFFCIFYIVRKNFQNNLNISLFLFSLLLLLRNILKYTVKNHKKLKKEYYDY